MFRGLLLLIGVLGWLMSGYAIAQVSPQDRYLQIYLIIQEADKLESSGQGASARARYEVALERLNKLKADHPSWEPTIVTYRIGYCRDRIKALQGVADANPNLPAPPIPPETQGTPSISTSNAPATPAPEAVAENPAAAAGTSELQKRIAELESELQSTRTQRDAARAEVDTLRRQKKELEAKLASLGSGDPKMAELIQENQTLRDRLAQAEKQLEVFESGNANESVARLQEQLRKVQEELTLARQQNESLAKVNEDFRKQLETVQAQLEQANTEISQLRTGRIAELEAEKKVLAGILDRALKEQARRAQARALAVEELKDLEIQSATLMTQLDILGSPVVTLSEQERSLLRVTMGDVAPTAAGPDFTAEVDSSGSSEAAPTPDAKASNLDYSTRAIVPREFEETARLASDLFSKGRFDEAAAQYQRILNAYPNSLYALSNLAVVRFQQANYAEAEELLRKAVRLAPTDAFSHSTLGIALYQQGKYDEAMAALTRAANLDPKDSKSRNYLGITLSQKGLQEAAERELRAAIQLDPNYGDAHFNLAVVYATQRPPARELSRRHYNRALELGIPRDEGLESIIR